MSETRRPRLSTVRARTTAAAVGAVGAVLTLGAVPLVVLLHHSMVGGLQTQLRLRADDVVTQAQRGPLPRHLAGGGEDGTVVQVLDDTGRVVTHSDGVPGDRSVAAFAPTGPGEVIRTVARLGLGDGSRYRLLARRASTPSGVLVVYAGASLEPTQDSVRTLIFLLAVGLSAVLALVGTTAWLLLGRALGPVEAIRRQFAEITARRLDSRVTEPPAMDEIGRLARTMNVTLGRLESSSRQQRAFVSDASHELRSPLASVRTQLEVAVAHPDTADYASLLSSLLDQHRRVERLVEDLLLLARSDEGRVAPRRLVDLDELVLREVIPVRSRGRVRVDLSAMAGGRVHGDPDALGRVVRNLIDNAERHARTMIKIELAQHANRVELVIADDGPGIPLEDRERVFERFARLDQDRSRHKGGGGLGLAIVSEVVTSHDGEVRVTGAPSPGGAKFIVTLPAERDEADA